MQAFYSIAIPFYYLENMKILSLYNNAKLPSISNNTQAPLKMQNLKSDTISFGYLFKDVDPNIQLYRSIGENEYWRLMCGDKIENNGMATSSSKGWQAQSWNSGYSNPNNIALYHHLLLTYC